MERLRDVATLNAVLGQVWSERVLPPEVRSVSALTDRDRVWIVATPSRHTGRWAYVLTEAPTAAAWDTAAEKAAAMCWFESSYA